MKSIAVCSFKNTTAFFFLFPGILRFFCLIVQNSQWHASCESFQEKIYVSLEYPPVDEQCAAQY
jgi:hypothetical protein